MASRLAARCAACGGSNVPPNSPMRIPGACGGRTRRGGCITCAKETAERWSRPDLPGAAHAILEAGELFDADRAAGMQLAGGDADLGAEAELAAVGELRRGVVQHDRRVDFAQELVGGLSVGGDDRVGVMRAVALDMGDGGIDVIVPRGGKSLVARVEAEARVPVFAHLEGVNHVYVDRSANLEMAKKIVLNAKMRRPGVCGAAETLLVDRAAAATNLKPLVEMLIDAGCEVRGDDAVQKIDTRVKPASDEDWDTEYEDAIISAKVVDGLDEALAHIQNHGSHHTDAIVTEDDHAAEKFLNEVDSAIVLHNASTQFADGGEFGFGAEIGIATGKFHARGPIGAEQLTSFKYRVHGTGQTRP